MAITLRPDHERLVTEAIETGAYETADDVIGRAFEQFQRGEFFSPDESRPDMGKRKAAWLTQQKR